MDYGPPKEFAPLARGKRGVGWHPHRRFAPVTLPWEGAGPPLPSAPITMLDVRLEAGARLPLALPASYNAMAVVAEGRVTASDAAASKGELLLFANDADHAELVATEPSHVIILSGEPLGEPVVAYGPF